MPSQSACGTVWRNVARAHRRGVEVHHEQTPAAPRGAIERHEPVNVLRRVRSQEQAWRLVNEVDELLLELLLGERRPCSVVADACPLEQQHIHVGRRALDKFFEGALAAVGAHIAGVEEPAPASIDNQRIERAVVGDQGRHGERPELDGDLVLEVARRAQVGSGGREEQRLAEQALRRFPQIDRNVGGDARGEPVVIGMTVGDNDPEQGRIARPEAADVRQGDVLIHLRGERPTEIEDQSMPVLFKLDAAASDLGCTAHDAATHHGYPA